MRIILLALVLSSCSLSEHTSNRFCGIIQEVRYTKGGERASVRARGMRCWFRYPNSNIHVGDTVELSMNNRIEPKF